MSIGHRHRPLKSSQLPIPLRHVAIRWRHQPINCPHRTIRFRHLSREWLHSGLKISTVTAGDSRPCSPWSWQLNASTEPPPRFEPHPRCASTNARVVTELICIVRAGRQVAFDRLLARMFDHPLRGVRIRGRGHAHGVTGMPDRVRRGSLRSRSTRAPSSQGGSINRSPRWSTASSIANPGGSVAISNRTPPGSRK